MSRLFLYFLAKNIRRPPTGQHFSIWVLVCWSPCAWLLITFALKTDTRRPAGQHFSIWLLACWSSCAWSAQNVFHQKKNQKTCSPAFFNLAAALLVSLCLAS